MNRTVHNLASHFSFLLIAFASFLLLGSQQALALSSVDTLSALTISSGTLSPTFATATTAYAASVTNATTSVTVTPTLTDATATIKVNDTTVTSGTASSAISLNVGSNIIRIVVTAQDGTTAKTYAVTVTRAALPSASTLSGLTINSGTLSPAFASDTYAYSDSVSNATTSVTVTPTLTDTTATMKVNNTTVVSGAASPAIPLTVGSGNVITILVTAADNSTIIYTVTVTRGPSPSASTLSALAISGGTLSPVFASATMAYAASVAQATSSVTVTPTLTNGSATVTVTVNGTTVASGAPISLPEGLTTLVAVSVTSQDGTSTTLYTVTILRPGPVNFTYPSAGQVPITISSYNATGNTVTISLGYAPTPGTNLTVVNNTGLGFITGQFSNLAQGQMVPLTYNGVTYTFVANYYGGTGNDLVLQWANQHIYSWGYNGYGQLGDNSTNPSLVPVAVSTSGVLSGKTVMAVAAGYSHNLALCSDGSSVVSVVAWGHNNIGQLGDGTHTDSSVPVAVNNTGVLSGKTVVAVAAGSGTSSGLQYYHSLALCSDGTVAAWGYNGYGQLGNGDSTFTSSSLPVAVTPGALSGKTVVAVAAGAYHSLALCSDGTVAAWGDNGDGELGNGGTTNSSVPVAVTGGALSGKTVVAVVAGAYHSLALCSDGTVAAWGVNYNGQLGNNTTSESSVPVAVNNSVVLSGKTVTAVAAGEKHSLALCSDGTVVAWGYNGYGELGNNSTNQSLVPVAVTQNSGALSGKTVVAVEAGAYHSLALCSDGTVAAWGYNGYGQLGNNSTSGSSVPVAVTTSGILSGKTVAVTAGSQHSLALASSSLPLSNVSALSSLALSDGTLSPSFFSGTTSYISSVANSVTSITVTPTLSDTIAGVRVNGISVASGVASAPITLGSNTINTITIVVTAQNGTTTSYIVTIDNTQYGIWKKNTFSTAAAWSDPQISGDLATPAHDGITNLLKYALALDPMTCGTGNLPASSLQGGYLTLTYRKNKSATDVIYTVQASDSLTANGWTPATTVTSQTDQGTYWLVAVRDTVPSSGHPLRFMRLKVSR